MSSKADFVSEEFEVSGTMALLEHTLIAVAAQICIGLTTRKWWAGACLTSGYFLGREIAQAEYRWIEEFGDGLRINLPWWGAADPRVWSTADQLADWLGPVLATTMIAWVMTDRQLGKA